MGQPVQKIGTANGNSTLQTIFNVNDVFPKFTWNKGKWPLEPLGMVSMPENLHFVLVAILPYPS